MRVPKNSYGCAICQKTLNNPTILIKHVELRHSIVNEFSKSPESESGSILEEKVSLNNYIRDYDLMMSKNLSQTRARL